MSSIQKGSGVAKQRLTGNQRKERRIAQALKLGISEYELGLLRRAKTAEWQREKNGLICSRCPNCGAFAHSFKWCPFAKDVANQPYNVTRFRGPNGSWNGEPPLQLSLKEKERFGNHFRHLSMTLGPTPNQTTLQNVQKGTTNHWSLYFAFKICTWLPVNYETTSFTLFIFNCCCFHKLPRSFETCSVRDPGVTAFKKI
jgi:hypothetical protein